MRRWVALGTVVVITPIAAASAANLELTSDSAKIEQIVPATTIVMSATTTATTTSTTASSQAGSTTTP